MRLDYYVIPGGLLVEEFALAPDHTAVGIDAALWTAGAGWSGGAAVSREIRTSLDARPVTRARAAEAYEGDLPTEEALRALLTDRYALPTAPPLRLGPADESVRVYRILCAGDLTAGGLTGLLSVWPMTLTDDPRIIGTARYAHGPDEFTWNLRRVGNGAAWAVDVTARLGDGPSGVLGALLCELRSAVQAQGLIPVTIDRFS